LNAAGVGLGFGAAVLVGEGVGFAVVLVGEGVGLGAVVDLLGDGAAEPVGFAEGFADAVAFVVGAALVAAGPKL